MTLQGSVALAFHRNAVVFDVGLFVPVTICNVNGNG